MSFLKRITNQITMSGDKKKRTNLQEEFNTLLQENMKWAGEEYQDAAEELERFCALVREKLSGHIPEHIVDEKTEEEPGAADSRDAVSVFYVSEDKMKAFACILPPINGGEDVRPDSFQEDIRYTGISHGLDQELVSEMIEDEAYLCPFLVAQGDAPENGRDGSVTDYFERRTRLEIEVPEASVIDFSQEITMQVVQKDALICRIQPAEKAKDGRDVVGNILPGTDGAEVELVPGQGTYLTPDGRQLLASVDGVISVTEEGHFCVEPQRTVSGDAGRHTGNLYCKGDLYISGNVRGDIIVKADGNIIIGGEVQEAEIRAGRNIRIQKGVIKGKEQATLRAGGQIQCALMEGVEAEAEGSVFAEVIMDSQVLSGGSLYVTSGRGLLIGGDVKARKNVTAKEIGNLSERTNCIHVGYEPELRRKLQALHEDLEETNSTLDKLQRNVSNLKSVGTRLPQEKRELLSKLEEQRTLYENKAEEQAEELKKLTVELRKTGDGAVSCETLYPTTEVYIGDKKTVVQRTLTPGRVFLQGDTVVAR